MKIQYSSGSGSNTPKAKLTEGDYNVMISKADVVTIKGKEKIVVDFLLENGEVHTEFVLPETWLPLFIDILTASGQEFDEEGGGEFDTDYLVGIEGVISVVANEGTGVHAGKTFYNVERFIKAGEEVKKK